MNKLNKAQEKKFDDRFKCECEQIETGAILIFIVVLLGTLGWYFNNMANPHCKHYTVFQYEKNDIPVRCDGYWEVEP